MIPYNLFFGFYNADWAHIILELFAGKLNTLSLENHNIPSYLGRGSVEILQKVSNTIISKK